MALIKTFFLLLPVIFLIDYIWLGKLMGQFYIRELGPLARSSGEGFAPVVWAAVLVYLFIPLGILVFVLPLLPPQGYLLPAIGYGALFGLVLYGVFDMTNYALLANYSLKMALVDIGWGCFLNSAATVAAVVIYRWVS
ncbi:MULTISPECIES: DUF2177 family protein [Desulfosediminicola]|uniref:DUF2177 family protein n=1 Tax=Desulfosediminicola TaxID=2886823 RepID=UPI0010AD87A3|nr:DUF2177 family protein [Desulfosediminicola ganghwensis]